jgi:hypothetical protein
VNGKPVVSTITTAAVIGCVPAPPTNPVSDPCTTATANGGFAQKLTVNGAPALLDTVTGTTNGTLSGVALVKPLVYTSGQKKLQAS